MSFACIIPVRRKRCIAKFPAACCISMSAKPLCKGDGACARVEVRAAELFAVSVFSLVFAFISFMCEPLLCILPDQRMVLFEVSR